MFHWDFHLTKRRC